MYPTGTWMSRRAEVMGIGKGETMNRAPVIGALALLVGGLAACGRTSIGRTPPGSGTVAGGLPPGTYSCTHHYTIWNVTFYEHYAVHVDHLRILAGGRYLSNLSDEEGGYSYDAASRTVSYTGVYHEEGYTGSFEPAEMRDDGRHHTENVTQVDGEDFTASCLGDETAPSRVQASRW